MSVTIHFVEHPFMACAVQTFEAESVAAWLYAHYGEHLTQPIAIYRGPASADVEVTNDFATLKCTEPAAFTVLQSPAGPGVIAGIQFLLAVVSVAMVLLASPPSLPANVNRTSTSANNALGNRTNQPRVLQRVEDIIGTVRSTPSMMAQTYFKYINHRKVECGYYCVGRGGHNIADVRDGDTPLEGITGSSAAFYPPFTSPNSGDAPQLLIGEPIIDKVLTVRRNNEVDGITLKALNQLKLTHGEPYSFEPDPAGDRILQSFKRPNFNAIMSPGDEITVVMPDATVGVTVAASASASLGGFSGNFAPSESGDGGEAGGGANLFANMRVGDTLMATSIDDPTNDGSYLIESIADDFLGVTPHPTTRPLAELTFTVFRNFSGTYTIAGVADGFIELTTSTFTSAAIGPADIDVNVFPPVSEWTDWFAQPAADRTETWNNLVALQGMFKDDGGKSAATVEIEWQLEKLDPSTLEPTGVVETFSGTLSGTVTQERAVTVEHATAWTGPCRIRGRRATPFDYDFKGTVIDEVTWVDLYSVSPVDKLHFGNKTTVQTITLATSRSTSVKERKLNLLATRLLPRIQGSGMSATFDEEGRLTSGTLYPTNRIADVLAAVALDPKIGNRQLAEVDLVQMAGVQAILDAWHPEMGQVNYTLDNDGMSFEETADLIANAGFCKAYRQSGKIRLAFDGPKASSSGLWTHRNKAYPLQETVTRSFASDGDYDGVEFVYQDPDTESAETISLPLDRSAVRPKKFEIAGIRSFAQAWRRAQREYRKILGQRIAIETRCLTDARSLLPFTRIDIVDNTKFKSYDGEVIDIDASGLMLRLSQPVVFLLGQPHSIVLVRRDGSLQAITCTPGPDRNQVVLQSLPTEAIVPLHGSDPAKGVPTMFSFGPDSKRGAQAYSVQEVGAPKDGYVLVKAANYSPDFYAEDTTDIPPSGSIIN